MSPLSSSVRPSDRTIRRCVACRELAPRSDLLRVVRLPDGEVHLSQREHGRGAYIHRGSECLTTTASAPKLLARALRRPPPNDILHQIAESVPN
ncbi:MAG: YlxR family protein [Chloroflexi bacterium]|nr:YlxR family protein [Chloroflexota bacterium]